MSNVAGVMWSLVCLEI